MTGKYILKSLVGETFMRNIKYSFGDLVSEYVFETAMLRIFWLRATPPNEILKEIGRKNGKIFFEGKGMRTRSYDDEIRSCEFSISTTIYGWECEYGRI